MLIDVRYRKLTTFKQFDNLLINQKFKTLIKIVLYWGKTFTFGLRVSMKKLYSIQ